MITQKELEEIKAGRPFWTVSGKKCTLLKSDIPGNQPLAIYVEGETEVDTYRENGMFTTDETGWDLTVTEPDHTCFFVSVNVTVKLNGADKKTLIRNIAAAIQRTEAQITYSTDAELIKISVEQAEV